MVPLCRLASTLEAIQELAWELITRKNVSERVKPLYRTTSGLITGFSRSHSTTGRLWTCECDCCWAGVGVWLGDTDEEDGDAELVVVVVQLEFADSWAGAAQLPPSPSWTIGLLDRSLRYSSTQKSSFGFGLGTGRRLAMGLGGILISGRHPNGGGSNDAGDFWRSTEGPLLPFSSFCCGGGGGGALGIPPPGKTCTGIPMLHEAGITGGVGGVTLG